MPQFLPTIDIKPKARLFEPKPFKYVPPVVRVAPEIAGYYTVGIPIMATVSIAAEAERMRTIEQRTKLELKKQYQEQMKIMEVPEGYRKPTFEEYKVEAEPVIRESLRRQAAIKGGISMGIFAAWGVSKGIGFIKKPIVSYKAPVPRGPMRKPIVSYKAPVPRGPMRGIIETQYRAREAYYRMYQYRPPVIRTTTTPMRKFLGLGPKEVKMVARPQIYVTEPFAKTLIPLKPKVPYLAQVGKVRRVPLGIRTEKEIIRYATFGEKGRLRVFLVGGVGKKVTPEMFAKLTKQEKYMFRPLFKETKPLMITKPKEILYVSKAVKVPQLPVKAPEWTYAVTRISKKLPYRPDWYAGVSPPEIMATKTAFKDITKGMYRARGAVPTFKGVLIKTTAKPPLYKIPKPDIVFWKVPPKVKPPTPLAKTFAIDKRGVLMPPKRVMPTFKPIPMDIKRIPEKIIKPKPPVPIPAQMQKVMAAPRQELIQITKPVEVLPKPYVPMPRLAIPRVTLKPPTQIERLMGLGVLAGVGETQLVKPSPRVIEKVGITPYVPEPTPTPAPPRQIPRVEEVTITKVVQKPIQIQVPTQPVIVTPKVTPKPPPSPIKFPVTVTPLAKPPKRIIKKVKPIIPRGYFPEVRRYGLWRKVGRPTEFIKAKRKGIAVVRETLAAAFRITRAERPVKLGWLPKEFRLAKVTPMVAIEKRPFRLKAKAEVREIIRAKKIKRKRKPKKLKWL